MNRLSLTPLEFTAVFGIAAAGAVWLYLLHQRPRRKIVSTLRFWESAEANVEPRRRRRIQEPWALLAQLLFLLLVILALANLHKPGWFPEDRSDVMLVDMSAWSQVQQPGEKPWAEEIRDQALRFLNRLPATDQVLLVRVDADASPVIPFTHDRNALRRAISSMRPADTAPDLVRALELADSAVTGKTRPLIAYFGPGRLDDGQARRLGDFRKALLRRDAAVRPRMLVRLVGAKAPVDNRGITRLALRRDAAQPDRWHLLTQVKNYGAQPATADLHVAIAGHQLENQKISLRAGETVAAHSEFTWAEGGILQAEIGPADSLAADNRAVAYLPSFRPVPVAVFSSDPRVLKPVLSANPFVRTEFVDRGRTPKTSPAVTIYEGVPPAANDTANQIVFVPGAAAQESRVTSWNLQHPVTRWIRTRDVSVGAWSALEPAKTDAVLAWSERTPLMLARESGGRKQVLLGFDPRRSNFPLQPAFPLLLAAAIEWMTAPVEESEEPVASGEARMPAATRIYSASGAQIPFARTDTGTQVLALRTGVYRAQSPEGETKIAVNLPPLPADSWIDGGDSDESDPPPPPPRPPEFLWRWAVLAAILPLWGEWMIYHRGAGARRAS